MSGRRPHIAIVTCANDLHALTIAARVRELYGDRCDVIESDSMAATGAGLTWSTSGEFVVPGRDGIEVCIGDVNVLWNRRVNMPQRRLPDDVEASRSGFISHSCTTTLEGILATEFCGTWVSEPNASRAAENKIIQLRAAVAAGLAIPKTLVSQDPEAVKAFFAEMSGEIVMKPLRAAPGTPLLTVRVQADHLRNADAIRLCPTIFQEYIAGTEHLRVLCCGGSTYAVSITSHDLDWRPNVDVECTVIDLDPLTTRRLLAVLRALNLKMGVFDLKVAGGEPVFLEVNPQGQFLFVQGLTGLDVMTGFAEFLHAEAERDIQIRTGATGSAADGQFR
jgi:glutathione synthase/RimK-type ligase-like ATP-grasp enzyme